MTFTLTVLLTPASGAALLEEEGEALPREALGTLRGIFKVCLRTMQTLIPSLRSRRRRGRHPTANAERRHRFVLGSTRTTRGWRQPTLRETRAGVAAS